MADTAFSLDRQQLHRSADAEVRLILLHATHAVQNQTRALEKDLEGITRVAVRGKLYRAWKSKAFPERGMAREPEGKVWINGGERSKGAIKFFTETGQVRQKDGLFFAIPTNRAGSRGQARMLTPGEWERREGVKLRFVYRRGKPSLLVADDVVRNGRGTRAVSGRNARGRVAGRKSHTAVIFVLIPHIEKQGRFAVEPVVRRRQSRLVEDFEARVRSSARS